MIYDNTLIGTSRVGYIAGTGTGIVTATGVPSIRDVLLFDVHNLSIVYQTQSFISGNYMIVGLDTTKEYLVMARDYKRDLEPFAWDYVKPANDLTVVQQQALWASWQT